MATLTTLHHVKLDDSIQDKYIEVFSKAATKEMLTHLRRELIQSVWAVILDDEFMDAYAHGFPFVFQDGVERRVFPRIFTYSADYPEKYVIGQIYDYYSMIFQSSPCLYQVFGEESVPTLSY